MEKISLEVNGNSRMPVMCLTAGSPDDGVSLFITSENILRKRAVFGLRGSVSYHLASFMCGTWNMGLG